MIKNGSVCAAVTLLLFPVGTMTAVAQKHYLEGQTYSVPLIQPDLRREEAVQQVADALQYLQKVSGDIFNRYSSFTPGFGAQHSAVESGFP